MRKVACLLAIAAALAFALPAMAQSSSASAAPQAAAGAPPNGQAQVPQPAQGGVNWKGVGIGAGTVAGNLVYVPAKVVYGILGGITGGASYLLTGGNTQTANTIWRSSLGGDYVLTPKMVSGHEPIHFSGPTTTAPAPGEAVPPSAGKSAMLSAPAQPNPPSTTASAAPPYAAIGNTATGPTAMNGSAPVAGVAQPADRGSGPVTPGNAMSGTAAGGNPRGVAAPPLPTTSIE